MNTQPLDTIKNQAHFTIFNEGPLEHINQQDMRPMVGPHVGCGLFGISDDFIEEYQSLDSKFVKNRASTFFFKAFGDSMEPLIHAGDVLVVDRSISNFQNRVCIVVFSDQLICKRVRINQGDGSVYLLSENPKHPPIVLNENLEASVWGVVIARVSHL